MRWIWMAMMFAIVSVQGGQAQVAPSEEARRLVAQVSEAFFDQLVREDFAREPVFMSESMAAMVSVADWNALRQAMIAQAGPTPRFRAHGLTFYPREVLYAAVDFSAASAREGSFICGYAIWVLPAPGVIGLERFEQTMVATDIMQAMPLDEAVQFMLAARCPNALIADILRVALR